VRALVRLAVALLADTLAIGAPPSAAARPGLCDAAVASSAGARIAVLAAFPAELAPLVARATVEERIEIQGHPFYLAQLGGVRVILGLMGIGMVNAAATTETLLAHQDVAALVISGVAGSTHRIADVVVPVAWRHVKTDATFAPNRVLVTLARRLAPHLELERCTPGPTRSGIAVCMPFRPRLFVGRHGESDDPFGGPFPCQPGHEVFGCELPAPAALGRARDAEPVAVDMETAAAGGVATGRDVPWVAFRAVSDGAEDPLGDRGFPAQFFDYYPLAARNAAAGTVALLERVAALGDGRPSRRRVCRLLAGGRWREARRRLH
jgi:nucleoside phosphorylase